MTDDPTAEATRLLANWREQANATGKLRLSYEAAGVLEDCANEAEPLFRALADQVRELRAQVEKGCDDCRRMVQALGGSTVRLYPDENYERYLDELTGSAVDGVGDAANEHGDEHMSALVRQLTEAVSALRRSRDELRRDMNRVALASISEERG